MGNAAEKIQEQVSFGIKIEKANLLKSVAKLQSIVEKRNTIPILSNVKLDASSSGLTLTVTDMDIVASEEIEANITAEGSVTVPALTLYDIVRKLPEGAQVSLTIDEASSRLNVEAGSSRFALSYLPSEDFPVMSEGELTHNFTLNSKDFLKLINKTKFAMSNEETRYYLNGVYLHVAENGNLKVVATDGHRLATVEIDAPEGSKDMPGVIIPRKTVNEVGKLLENQEEIKISLSDSKIKFNAGKIELLSKVVDGTFPDYQRVIPSNNPNHLKTAVDDFKESIDRVATIAIDKTKAVKVKLSKNNINFSAQGFDGATADEDLQAEYDADEIEIGFNSRYILEMIGNIEGEFLTFDFDNPNAPVVVKDPTDDQSLFIIMPMRV
jgi:DNA polymerase-3 subunit beta